MTSWLFCNLKLINRDAKSSNWYQFEIPQQNHLILVVVSPVKSLLFNEIEDNNVQNRLHLPPDNFSQTKSMKGVQAMESSSPTTMEI